MESLNLPGILTPDFGLFFWMMIAFITLFVILAKFAFPTITKMVESRSNFINESLQNAHEANSKLASIRTEGENILREAREKQADILKEAMATRDSIVREAQVKAQAEGCLKRLSCKSKQKSKRLCAKFVRKWPAFLFKLPKR